MRVLWFVEKPLFPVADRLGMPAANRHGSWLDQYEVVLRSAPEVVLGVAAPVDHVHEPFEHEGVAYYALGGRVPTGYRRVARRWYELARPTTDLRQCQRVIEAFRPDLVHIHGTERQFGLLAAEGPVPVIMSIQGLLSACELMDRRGADLSLLRSLSPSLLLRGTGTLLDHVGLMTTATRERRIIRHGTHFIGRTRWDADVVHVLNPAASYYHCDELLRPEFRQAAWDPRRSGSQTVYCTAGGYARKGVGTLLRAVALLRARARPGVCLRIGGGQSPRSEGGRATAREIRRLGLSDCVATLGRLDATDIARELLNASVFALPTHIDNSSNALSEALMVGTPCVSSAAGGIPTIARDGVDALLVQDGDPYALAGAILRLLENPELAQRLSRNARATALRRHDPERVRRTLLGIYESVLADTHSS